MVKKYIVIDSEGGVSWSEKDELPESFAQLDFAVKRAREVAASEP